VEVQRGPGVRPAPRLRLDRAGDHLPRQVLQHALAAPPGLDRGQGSTIYEVGDTVRSFFFRRGIVKVCAVTEAGRELIYDLRKDGALSSAYDQVTLLSSGGTVERLVKVLLRLATQFGRASGRWIEIDAYFTQEEISHMMASSREKVSVALNRLRGRAMVHYSRGGHLLLDVPALES